MAQTPANQEWTLLREEFSDEDRCDLNKLVPLVQSFYADKVRVAPRLRYWYTMKHLAEHLIKEKYQDSIDRLAGDEREHGRERIVTLEAMIARAQTEINKIEATARANRPGQIGQMTTTAPVGHPGECINPNAARYRGDPRFRTYKPN